MIEKYLNQIDNTISYRDESPIRNKYKFKVSVLGDMRAWHKWMKINFQLQDIHSRIQEYMIWRNSLFDHECELILWYLTSNYDIPFNIGTNKGSDAVFLVLDRKNPNNFKQIDEGLDLFIENAKGNIPIISLLSCSFNIDEEDNDLPITSNSEIDKYINEISAKYQTYVPYFDLDNFYSLDDPMIILNEIVFANHYMKIKIKDKYTLDMIHYIYNQNKESDYTNQLKKYIENSPNEEVLFLIIACLSEKMTSQNYFQDLQDKTSNWCQLLIKLILKNVDLQDLKKHLNSTNNKFYLDTFIQRIDDIDILKDIVMNNQYAKFRLIAFNKLPKPIDEEFLKKIVWTIRDSNLISKAVFLITDQDELKKIIFGNFDWDIKTAALNNLKPPFEPKLLRLLNFKSDNSFKILLVEKIKNDTLLRNIIFNGYGWRVRAEALDQLSEYTDDFLISLILSDDEKFISYFKMGCIQKLTDEGKKLDLYYKLTEPSLKNKLLKTLKSIQPNLSKEILFEETDINIRQTAINKTLFDDRFSIDEFTRIIKTEKSEYGLRTIISNCKSLKLLNAIRLLMDEKYQPLIKKQMNKTE